jgi:type III secretion system YscQ/HrcQ family protein
LSAQLDAQSAPRAEAGSPVVSQEALAQRLPRVDLATQRLANLLYGPLAGSSLSAWDRFYTWRWRYHARAVAMPEMARLVAPEGEVWLAIDRDYGFCPDRTVDWRPFSGDARLIAWAISYEPLIEHLRKLLGLALQPAALITSREISAASAHRCWLTFGVEDGGETLLSGVAAFERDLMPHEIGVPAIPSRHPSQLNPIPITIRIVLASLSVPLPGVRELAAGDVISLGKSARLRDGSNLLGESIDQRLRLALRIDRGGLRVENIEYRPARAQRTSHGHGSYGDASLTHAASGSAAHVPNSLQATTRSSSMPPNAEDPAAAADVDALSVTLTFEVGELVLSVGELKGLAPGSALSLARKLPDSPVTVRANGRAIATGELVLIDDFLGVRITGLRSHGPE